MISRLRILALTFLVLICLSLTACGGSGSSGFDASTFAVEQETIQAVTQDGGCAEAKGTTICAPADSDLPGITGPEGFDGPVALAIDLEAGSIISCVQETEGENCEFKVSTIPLGFQNGTTFLAAVRLQDSTSPWKTGPSSFVPSMSDPAVLEVMIGVSELQEEEPRPLQLAVLVYLPSSKPAQPGSEDQLLRNFQTDVVYVVNEITVEVGGLP